MQPEAGKTYMSLDYAIKSKKKFCIVTPYNKAIIDIKKMIKEISNGQCKSYQVMIFLEFFNLDQVGNKLNNKRNYNDFELVIFEEIYTINSNYLLCVHKFMQKNTDIMTIVNGDMDQLTPIHEKLSDKKRDELINYLFPNHIYLKISKRFTHDKRFNALGNLIKKNMNECIEKQRECAQYIVEELFNNQHITQINSLDTKINLSYKNETIQNVNDIVHNQLLKKRKKGKDKYYAGLKLICKKRLKQNDYFYNVNQEYKINNVKGDEIFIDGNKLTKILIEKHFTLIYCWTGLSAQGITIKEKYCIFDWNYEYVDLKWLYVAITRATNLDNVYFYTGDKFYDNKFDVKQKIYKMISRYKQQDTNAKRENDE